MRDSMNEGDSRMYSREFSNEGRLEKYFGIDDFSR
jgi:hypothetical protein